MVEKGKLYLMPSPLGENDPAEVIPGPVLKSLEGQIDVALEAVGLQAEGYAKLKCPVDTGRLRNSLTHVTEKNSGQAKSFTYDADIGGGKTVSVTDTTILSAEKNQVVIGSNVEYAGYV